MENSLPKYYFLLVFITQNIGKPNLGLPPMFGNKTHGF